MSLYYVNNKSQPNGDHEVHKSDCTKIPLDKKYLGNFSTCQEAVREAKKTYSKSNGCYWCSNQCHTS